MGERIELEKTIVLFQSLTVLFSAYCESFGMQGHVANNCDSLSLAFVTFYINNIAYRFYSRDLPGWALSGLENTMYFLFGITLLCSIGSFSSSGRWFTSFFSIRFPSISWISCSRIPECFTAAEEFANFLDHSSVGWKGYLMIPFMPLSWGELIGVTVMDDTDLPIRVYRWCSRIKWWTLWPGSDDECLSICQWGLVTSSPGLKYGDRYIRSKS